MSKAGRKPGQFSSWKPEAIKRRDYHAARYQARKSGQKFIWEGRKPGPVAETEHHNLPAPDPTDDLPKHPKKTRVAEDPTSKRIERMFALMAIEEGLRRRMA